MAKFKVWTMIERVSEGLKAHKHKDGRLDICLLVETWHVSITDTALRRCVPPGYQLQEVARPSAGDAQNHGGIAAVLRSDIRFRQHKPKAPSKTFESMAFTVSSAPSTMAILVLYRPGSARISNEFFEELTEYLESIALYKCQILIAGDLNVHVERRDDAAAIRLLELLRSFDCIQHVSGPTHVDGGTLDHIYTRSDEIVDDLRVEPAGTLSDHGFITWSMKFTRPPPISSRKTVCGWKNMDRHAFRQALSTSVLCESAIPTDADAETLFGLYDSVLLELANKFAPTRTITVHQQPIAVWFDDECRRMRRLSRVLEKRYRRSGDSEDRLAWVQQERERHRIYRVKESVYWSTCISESSAQSKKVVGGLLEDSWSRQRRRRPAPSPLSAGADGLFQ